MSRSSCWCRPTRCRPRSKRSTPRCRSTPISSAMERIQLGGARAQRGRNIDPAYRGDRISLARCSGCSRSQRCRRRRKRPPAAQRPRALGHALGGQLRLRHARRRRYRQLGLRLRHGTRARQEQAISVFLFADLAVIPVGFSFSLTSSSWGSSKACFVNRSTTTRSRPKRCGASTSRARSGPMAFIADSPSSDERTTSPSSRTE